MRALTLIVLLSAGVAQAGKATKLGEEFVLQLDETATLPGGATVKFVALSVEEIAASPDDPKSYPAGSGVNVSLEFRGGSGAARVERIELNLLSAGYTSKSSAASQGYQLVLLTADEHARAKVTLRIDRVPVTDTERANIKKLAAQRNAPLAFVIKVVSIIPLFPIDDMPSGYGTWQLKAELIEVVNGSLSDAKASPFETKVEIWMGAVRKRPAGLWVNEQPAADSLWVVLANASPANASKLLSGRGDGAIITFEKDKLAQYFTR